MARQTIEQLIDDLDGSPADRTVRFGYGGSEYEIELSDGHATDFAEALERYLAAARRVGGRRGSAGRRSATESRARSAVDTASVRAWAEQQGIEVSARGRVSGQVIEAYQAAQAAAQAGQTSGDQAAGSTRRRRRAAATEQTTEAPRVGRRRRGDPSAQTAPRRASRRRRTAGSNEVAVTEPVAEVETPPQ